MGTPAFLYFIVASQGLPVVAVLAVGGRRPSIPHRRLAILCCVFLISDLLMRAAALLTGNNHWVSWFMQPCEVALTLWLLSWWQPHERLRRLYLRGMSAFVLASGVVLLVTNPWVTFDRWVNSAQALVALAASLHTAVHRSLLSREMLTDQGWFWICSGLALFWMTIIPISPFVDALLPTHVGLVRDIIIARACLIPAAFCLMTWGVMCKRRSPELPGLSSVRA